MAAEFVDSVHLPEMPGQPPDEKMVRPSLAILFRMAVGPDADYYAPRFLEYERTGRSFPSWNWSAFMAPGVWAIYRRLWAPGIAFTVWPFLGLRCAGSPCRASATLGSWVLPWPRSSSGSLPASSEPSSPTVSCIGKLVSS